MKPLVSVYITTYNRLALLKRAVDSVLNQSYLNIELFVVDDGSKDGTHDYLKKMQQRGLLTAVVNNGPPKGACFGRNRAIQLAKGEFITGLDDDDYLQSWRIETFVSFWRERVSNSTNMAPIAGLFDSVIELRADGKYKYNETSEVSYSDLRRSNKVGNQIFTKVEYLKQVKGFDINMPALQDWETWIRLAEKYGNFVNVLSYSYVIDMAHGESRISEKKASQIQQAFNLLKDKLAPLTLTEKIKHAETMYTYHQMNLCFKDFVFLMLGLRLRRLAQIFKRMILQ